MLESRCECSVLLAFFLFPIFSIIHSQMFDLYSAFSYSDASCLLSLSLLRRGFFVPVAKSTGVRVRDFVEF